jgi:hypothetical protein
MNLLLFVTNLLLFVMNLLSFVMLFAKSDVCGYRTFDHRFCRNLRSLREIFWRFGVREASDLAECVRPYEGPKMRFPDTSDFCGIQKLRFPDTSDFCGI